MSSKDTDHVAFLTFILLACGLWTHKALIARAEHIAKYVIVVIVCLIVITFVVRVAHKLHKPNFVNMDNMAGLEFEHYVTDKLKSIGYQQVRLTEEYDLGIDIIAEKNGIRWGIQVKRYSGLVGADAVRQVVTALKYYNCQRAMVVTNSNFSYPAIVLADSNDCLLIDGHLLSVWTQ